MKLWRITQENSNFTVEGFLSEKDADTYTNLDKGNWVKEEYEGTKLDSSKKEFLQFFGITKQKISNPKLREYLEATICNSYYEAEPIFVEDKKYECFGYYTVSYYCDQWWACGLNKSVKLDDNYYLEEIARGEGDGPLDALCALFILKNDLFINKNELNYFKSEIGNFS